jgi:hypothetical protein
MTAGWPPATYVVFELGYGLSANYLAIAELAPNGFPAIKAEP